MNATIDLQRFTSAHQENYATALKEIQRGRKQSHWMWYIFPQVEGLGYSYTSRFYAIRSLEEAKAFLQDPYLGGHLSEICNELLRLETNNATEVFGKPDDIKLCSSMTLFCLAAGSDSVFAQVLDKFFNGKQDAKTKRLLNIE